MSNIRYQVFVSSTYADLKNERASVSQALMEMNCIPTGMELFPASSEEQFQFIKSVIDDSDYYVLIIGGRYGSIDASGISYTEKEFDYALSKGMEVCVFVHSDPGKIAAEKTDKSRKLEIKLEAFRKRVATGRLVKFWDDPRDLPGKVVTSLNSAIRRKPSIGWVRGNQLTSPDILEEIIRLREENSRLKNSIEKQGSDNPRETSELNRQIKIIYKTFPPPFGLALGNDVGIFDQNNSYQRRSHILTVGEVIEKIGFSMVDKPSTIDFNLLIPQPPLNTLGIKTSLDRPRNQTEDESKDRIRLALTALGFVECVDRKTDSYIFTEKGKLALLDIATR